MLRPGWSSNRGRSTPQSNTLGVERDKYVPRAAGTREGGEHQRKTRRKAQGKHDRIQSTSSETKDMRSVEPRRASNRGEEGHGAGCL